MLPRGASTLFKLTANGKLTTLYRFSFSDGDYPDDGLFQATNGTLYGTTADGGANGLRMVFSLSVGLGPFVETQPTAGKVGAVIKILGTNLKGATGVSFNGIPAVFKVISNSLIGAVVPTGATSGKVQVVTPSGTLSSNVPFRLKQ